uniref:Uncharacterized protein n=1 Tax=Anguilla anguilla TaxID=7936 RepID=A0A0E9TDV7_ANGAN
MSFVLLFCDVLMSVLPLED